MRKSAYAQISEAEQSHKTIGGKQTRNTGCLVGRVVARGDFVPGVWIRGRRQSARRGWGCGLDGGSIFIVGQGLGLRQRSRHRPIRARRENNAIQAAGISWRTQDQEIELRAVEQVS